LETSRGEYRAKTERLKVRVCQSVPADPLLLESLQALLQKIDLRSLLADLALQLSYFRLVPATLSHSWKCVAGTMAEFFPSAVQQIRVYLGGRRACYRLLNRSQFDFL
jgi:hypothetical protein